MVMVLYLIVDYGRPQDILPIGILYPGVITIVLLTLYTLFNARLFELLQFRQMKDIFLFLILLAAYIPFAVNNRYAFNIFTLMMVYGIFIITVLYVVDSVDVLRKFFLLYILIMIYQSIYGIFHRGFGSGNYFKDENDLSLYINMVIPFCYFLIPASPKARNKFILFIGLCVGLITDVICFSRGAFVGLVVIGLVILYYSKKRILTLLTVLLIGVIFYIATQTVTGFILPSIKSSRVNNYWDEMNTILDLDKGSANERILIWKAAWRMFLDNPWGVGGNNFLVRIQEYQGNDFQRGMWGKAAHSLWFTLLPEMGIIGVILYLRLIYSNYRDILFLTKAKCESASDTKYLNMLGFSFLASLAGFFTSGSFLSVLYYPHYWYLTGIIMASAKIARTTAASNKTEVSV